MRLLFLLLTSVLFMSCLDDERKFEYPSIENIQKVETHFNMSYVNDYVNLEKFKDSSMVRWFHQQDSIAEDYFESKPAYKKYLSHIKDYGNDGASGISAIKYDEREYTYYLKDSDSAQSLIRRKTINGIDEQLFDISAYSDMGWIIDYYKPSYDGMYIAIAMGKETDFFKSILIFDTTSKEVVVKINAQTKPDMVGGIVWTQDSRSILFIAYPNTSEEKKTNDSFMAVYNLGQDTDSPASLFKDGDFGVTVFPEFFIIPKIRSEQDNYVFVYIANANEYWDCYYMSYEAFRNEDYKWQKLFDEKDMVLNDYGTERNHLFYYKRLKGGNIQLCQLDLRNPDSAPKILFEGSEGEQLSSFKVLGNATYYTVSKNGIEESLYKINSDDLITKVVLPKVPGEINFKYRSPYLNDLWVQLNGWTINYEDYKVTAGDILVQESFPIRKSYPEFNDIVSEVVEIESHDGVMVPVSIVRQKDFKKTGKNKAIISVYGAYGISETPWFHEPILDFVNQGNIYVTAHVRGGGEKGPQWHEDGMLLNKPNSWKDLNHAAKFLINEGWVHPKKIGLNANSAGAINVGMAVNTEPQLYNALTIFNGAVNGIRTESIEGYDTTDNTYEFGSTADSTSFKSFLQLDPVVNFNTETKYPSTLLLMDYQDYLIPPSANGKYIALMQGLGGNGDTPYLLDVDFEGEHEIDWYADYAKAIFFINTELDR